MDKIKIVCLHRPSGYDFITAIVIDGLNQLDCVDICCQYRSNNAIKVASKTGILERCKDADIILLFSNREWQQRKLLVKDNNLLYKTIYIDGSDGDILEDNDAIEDFNIIFKREVFLDKFPTDFKTYGRDNIRELYKDKIYNKIFPLPLAVETHYFRDDIEDEGRPIPISCTLRRREHIVSAVRSLNIEGAIIGPVSNGGPATHSTDPSKEAYFRVLKKSLMSVSYPGGGCWWESGRFWEILGSGALLLSPRPQLLIPDPFLPEEHFIRYDSLEELKEKVIYYINNREKALAIAKHCMDFVLKYHTSKARAEYMLKIIRERTALI